VIITVCACSSPSGCVVPASAQRSHAKRPLQCRHTVYIYINTTFQNHLRVAPMRHRHHPRTHHTVGRCCFGNAESSLPCLRLPCHFPARDEGCTVGAKIRRGQPRCSTNNWFLYNEPTTTQPSSLVIYKAQHTTGLFST
jgi:hypothetical protein